MQMPPDIPALRRHHPTLRIAFQGARGAWADHAIDRVWGVGAHRLVRRSFDGVVYAVANGLATFGVLPVHYVISGPVADAHEAMRGARLREHGHIDVPIHHCLLGVPGASLGGLDTVYSHSVALQQCLRFIGARGLDAVSHYNTAVAARYVARRGLPNEAAIASEACAARYGLAVLARHISDRPDNVTRFVLLSRAAASQGLGAWQLSPAVERPAIE